MSINLESWYSDKGKKNDIVIYSKVSIARNVSEFLFPSKISYDNSKEILNMVFSFFDSLPESKYFKKVKINDIDPLAIKLLEERGCLSSNLPSVPEKGIVIHDMGHLCVGINTEDHLNISSFGSGFDIEKVYFMADDIESKMQEKLFFSAGKDLGFITSDIMSIGSGVKFSVLCSLPGLLFSNKISEVVGIAKEANLIVSGYYAQDSKDSIGSLFSISSSICAGGNVHSQMSDFIFVLMKIIKLEEEARSKYVQDHLLNLEDMINRSFSIATNAKLITFKESIDIIFKLKFGLNFNLLSGITHEQCNSILFKAQTGHLAFLILNTGILLNKNVTESSIEEYRAKLLKNVCSGIKLKV